MARKGHYQGAMLEKKGYGGLIATALVSLVVLAGFAIWQARPLYRWARAQRAVFQVPEIDRLAAEERWPDAFSLMHKLYHMGPEEPEILRAAARISIAKSSPEALVFLNKLVELGEATYEDRRDLAKVHAGNGDIDRAEAIIGELLEERPKDLVLLGLQVEVLLKKESHRPAMLALNDLIKLDPADDKRRLLLARLLIAHGFPEERSLGWKYMAHVANNPGELGIEALDVLMHADGLPKEGEIILIGLLEGHPLAEERHRVEALKRSVRAHPEQRDELIAAALEERKDWSAKDLNPIYRWLTEEEEYGTIIEKLSMEKASESRNLITVYLHALGQVKDWNAVRETLENSKLPISETSKKILSALCSWQLKDDSTVAEIYLLEALETVKRFGNHPEAYVAGAIAERIGYAEIAEAAYELAKRSQRSAELAFQGLLRLAIASGNGIKLREVVQQYHYRYPRRPQLKERLLYLNALLGFEVEATLTESLNALEEEPFRIPPRIIAGMAYFRMHDFGRAMEVCSEAMKPEEMTAGQLSVYAAILNAANRRELGREIAGKVALDELLREEGELLGGL